MTQPNNNNKTPAIKFEAIMQKIREKDDLMTNWTFILITAKLAEQMNHKKKTGFRVSGKLDDVVIDKIALQPNGEGDFYMPLKAEIRKALRKEAGAKLIVNIYLDREPPPINAALIECLQDEPRAWTNFTALKPSHQLYFSNWVNSAKTAETKSTRIGHCVNALMKNFDYGQMIRSLKKDK